MSRGRWICRTGFWRTISQGWILTDLDFDGPYCRGGFWWTWILMDQIAEVDFDGPGFWRTILQGWILTDHIAGVDFDGPGFWWTKSQGWILTDLDFEHSSTEEEVEHLERHAHQVLHGTLRLRPLQLSTVFASSQSQSRSSHWCSDRSDKRRRWIWWQHRFSVSSSVVNSIVNRVVNNQLECCKLNGQWEQRQ